MSANYDTTFEIEGWDDFVKNFEKFVDSWEAKLEQLLWRIGHIYHAAIIPYVPVKTSTLITSIDVLHVNVSGAGGYVEVGTPLEYARYVDEGHIQHKRFLPATYLKNKVVGGIMLKEKFVEGKHFMDKGMTDAKPLINEAINSFMEESFKEIERAKINNSTSKKPLVKKAKTSGKMSYKPISIKKMINKNSIKSHKLYRKARKIYKKTYKATNKLLN